MVRYHASPLNGWMNSAGWPRWIWSRANERRRWRLVCEAEGFGFDVWVGCCWFCGKCVPLRMKTEDYVQSATFSDVVMNFEGNLCWTEGLNFLSNKLVNECLYRTTVRLFMINVSTYVCSSLKNMWVGLDHSQLLHCWQKLTSLFAEMDTANRILASITANLLIQNVSFENHKPKILLLLFIISERLKGWTCKAF